MFYLASSKSMNCYIIGQTSYSEYYRAEYHFKNSVLRLNLDIKEFDYFNVFSIPGEEEEYHKLIKDLDEKGFFPLNKSSKYLSYIYEITGNAKNFFEYNKQRTELLEKHKTPKTTFAYGENKRVILRKKQYEDLCNEFTQEKVDGVIFFLDEYLEGNNNKNNYSNYYVLMKRAIREKWYDDKIESLKLKKQAEQHQEPVPDFINDFLKEIK